MRLARLELDPARAEPAIARLLDAWPDGALVREDVVTVVGDDLPVEQLRDAAGTALIALTEDDVDEPGVRRLSARSRTIAGRVVLRAPEADAPADGLIDIVVEREDGVFGTGSHPTTEALVALLVTLEPRGSLLDVGCGTGVLAIVASRLGFDPVTGVDIDPGAVACARRVAERNGAVCTFTEGDALAGAPPDADLTVANVPPQVHLALAPRIASPTVLVSGVLDEELAPVLAAYAAAGLAPVAGGVTPSGWFAGTLAR